MFQVAVITDIRLELVFCAAPFFSGRCYSSSRPLIWPSSSPRTAMHCDIQTKLQEQIPSLDTCEEAIPAVVFGTYDFPLEAALQVRFQCELPLPKSSA